MKEIRTESDVIKTIAEKLIETEDKLTYIRNSAAEIVYLQSNKEKKIGDNLVFGECEKIPQKYKWKIPADFAIVIYSENCSYFDDEQLKILIFHELLHIKVDVNSKGEFTYSTKPHDLEDFKYIIDTYGVDWAIPKNDLFSGENDDL